MVFAEIESQLRTEGGWNMHIAIALIMALLVTAGVLWFFFAPRKSVSCAVARRRAGSGRRSQRRVQPGRHRSRSRRAVAADLRSQGRRRMLVACRVLRFRGRSCVARLPHDHADASSRPAGRVSLRMRYEHAARHVAHTAGKACKCRCRRRFRGNRRAMRAKRRRPNVRFG